MCRPACFLALILAACVPADPRDAPRTDESTGTATNSSASASSGMDPSDGLPPTEANAMRDWLAEGLYLDWMAELGIHPSQGAHLGSVRTYVNDVLAASLLAGEEAHPQGSTAVKELYGGDSSVVGWAVSVKTAADSEAGTSWYWYEFTGAGTNAAELGAPVCTGCHLAGLDFVLTTSFSAPAP